MTRFAFDVDKRTGERLLARSEKVRQQIALRLRFLGGENMLCADGIGWGRFHHVRPPRAGVGVVTT